MSDQSDIQPILVIEGGYMMGVQDQIHLRRFIVNSSVTLVTTFEEGLERATTRQYRAIIIGSETLTDGGDPEELLHELNRLKCDDASEHPSDETLLFFHHDGTGLRKTFEASSEGSMFYCVTREHPGLLTEALWKAGLRLEDSLKSDLTTELKRHRKEEKKKRSAAA